MVKYEERAAIRGTHVPTAGFRGSVCIDLLSRVVNSHDYYGVLPFINGTTPSSSEANPCTNAIASELYSPSKLVISIVGRELKMPSRPTILIETLYPSGRCSVPSSFRNLILSRYVFSKLDSRNNAPYDALPPETPLMTGDRRLGLPKAR